jgi:hypothetical protein
MCTQEILQPQGSASSHAAYSCQAGGGLQQLDSSRTPPPSYTLSLCASFKSTVLSKTKSNCLTAPVHSLTLSPEFAGGTSDSWLHAGWRHEPSPPLHNTVTHTRHSRSRRGCCCCFLCRQVPRFIYGTYQMIYKIAKESITHTHTHLHTHRFT